MWRGETWIVSAVMGTVMLGRGRMGKKGVRECEIQRDAEWAWGSVTLNPRGAWPVGDQRVKASRRKQTERERMADSAARPTSGRCCSGTELVGEEGRQGGIPPPRWHGKDEA